MGSRGLSLSTRRKSRRKLRKTLYKKYKERREAKKMIEEESNDQMSSEITNTDTQENVNFFTCTCTCSCGRAVEPVESGNEDNMVPLLIKSESDIEEKNHFNPSSSNNDPDEKYFVKQEEQDSEIEEKYHFLSSENSDLDEKYFLKQEEQDSEIEEKNHSNLSFANSDLDEKHFLKQEAQDRILPDVLGIEGISSQTSKVIERLRIIDLKYVMNMCMEYQYKHLQQCTRGLLRVHREQRRGFDSNVTMKCSVCEYEIVLSTQRPV